MDSLSHLRRQFAASDWAHRTCLEGLAACAPPPPRSVAWMGHIVGTEWLWLGRLQHAAEPAAVWPELSLAECAEQLVELSGLWQAYLAGRTEATLDEEVSYVNSLGQPWTSQAHDVLAHVLQHGAYHRGQIAAVLRAAGHDPAYTDTIHGLRSGQVRT